MKKLHELLGKKPLKGDIGIEIECEGKGFKEVNTEVWVSHDDGSLRGIYPTEKIEYVLSKPIPLETVKPALEELNALIKGCVPAFSFRTSVHVHVNVLELTEDQFFSFMYTYFLLEEALFSFCGNSRKSNRFCLRLHDSDVIGMNFLRLIRNGVKDIKNIDPEATRYSAMNMAATKKYGSLEFRGMRGTLDPNLLNILSTALISIRNYACHMENMLAVHDEFVTLGSEKFLSRVIGDELAKNFTYPKVQQDMMRSYSLSIDLPYTYQKVKEEEKKREELKMESLKFNEGVIKWKDIDAAADLNQAIAAIPRPQPALRVRRPAAIPPPGVFDDIQLNPGE